MNYTTATVELGNGMKSYRALSPSGTHFFECASAEEMVIIGEWHEQMAQYKERIRDEIRETNALLLGSHIGSLHLYELAQGSHENAEQFNPGALVQLPEAALMMDIEVMQRSMTVSAAKTFGLKLFKSRLFD